MKAGQTVRVGYGTATVLPGADFETASEAGFHWDAERGKWTDPPGAAKNNRGLKVVGRRNYIKHPSFRVLSLAWDLKDGKGPRLWYPNQATLHTALQARTDMGAEWAQPWELLDYVAAGGLLKAWNSGFEFDVWNEYCVPTWGWPKLKLEQTRCAMAQARAHAGPGSLAKFGEVFKLNIQKDKEGDRLLKKFSVPQNPTKKRPTTWIYPHDDPQDFRNLLLYNGTDVLSEGEASLKAPDLSPEELQFWLTDQRINLRGIQVDTVAMENCIEIVRQAYEKYNAELRTLTGHAVQAASEVAKLQTWLHGRGVHMDSMDEEAVGAMLSNMEKHGWGQSIEYRALKIRGLLGSASIKKLYAFKHQNHLGRLYDLYTFFGARTGRWTGNGPQPQNLPTGLFASLAEVEEALSAIATRCLEYVEYAYSGHNALEVVSSCLRGLLIAAPGHEFICSDYTSIEGVITAELAGEDWALEVFHTHMMIYEATAAKIAKLPFDDFVKHRIDTGGKAFYEGGKLMGMEGGKHHPLRKKLGKYGVLASGFGGWIGAWKNFGADEFMTDAEIKDAILAWRAASPNTVEMWGGQTRGRFDDARPELYGFEGAAIAALRYPGQAFNPKLRGHGSKVVYQYSPGDDILYCRVPSGGYLTYHRPRLEPSRRDWAPDWEVGWSYEGDNKNPKMGPIGWVRMSNYGGKQTENIVQKEGRTIHATGLVALERAGYRPVLHSHDEPCGEVPAGWGSVEQFEALMTAIARDPTSFCYGWPIKAKGGWRGPRYGKFD